MSLQNWDFKEIDTDYVCIGFMYKKFMEKDRNKQMSDEKIEQGTK